ncbi:uncharacterized protein VTP21DRAFT_3359 [Calcarisporiella thermophila]|uniref:uncharacterized protein n=1 Tax=Calcarisporiella thermophila TaxID=911321 RepID=UPI0037436896
MDINWCLVCEKKFNNHDDDLALYCSIHCARADSQHSSMSSSPLCSRLPLDSLSTIGSASPCSTPPATIVDTPILNPRRRSLQQQVASPPLLSLTALYPLAATSFQKKR